MLLSSKNALNELLSALQPRNEMFGEIDEFIIESHCLIFNVHHASNITNIQLRTHAYASTGLLIHIRTAFRHVPESPMVGTANHNKPNYYRASIRYASPQLHETGTL